MKKKLKLLLHKIYLFKFFSNEIHRKRVLKDPKNEANKAYKSVFKKNINWENPSDLIEKIYWLQFNSDTQLWTKCADKYLVRDYINSCGYEDYMPKLYAKWDKISDIDFSILPEKFVIKANNGCGTVMIVKDKSLLSIEKVKKTLNRWLNFKFGYSGAQLHYLNIKPCIIAEELLENNVDDKRFSPNSLVDYKVYCINGEPEIIWIAYDRTYNGVYNTAYDINWVKKSEYLVSSDYYTFHEREIPKPACLDKIIEISRGLSKSFPQVRVDFYIINNIPYIGELTFTTGYGFFTKEFYEYLGNKIDLNLVKDLDSNK